MLSTEVISAYAGPTIFVTRPKERVAAFALGLALVAEVGRVLDSTAYLLSAYAITITDVAISEALCRRAKQLCTLRPHSLLTGSALVVIGYQVHVSTIKLRPD